MPMMPPWTKPFCWVRSSRKGSAISTTPGATSPRLAPISAIACWRPKLARMRSANRESAGAFIEPGRLLDVYVNVNLAAMVLTAAAAELLAHALLEGGDLGELRLDIGTLPQQAPAVRLQHLAKALELRPLVAPRLVHVDQLADLGERETEALAAQGELEARAVARGVNAPLAVTARCEQPLVFVEADRARCDIELAREFADGKFGALGFHARV